MVLISDNSTILSQSDLKNEVHIRDVPKSQTAELLFFGDLVPDGKVGKALSSANPKELIDEIKSDINKSDLNVINLEAPLTNIKNKQTKEGPVLAGNPASIYGIKEIGFNVINLANNHILDMGDVGLWDTINSCKRNGLMTVGAGKNINEASIPLFTQINGIKLGIIAVAENEYSTAKHNSAGCASMNVISNYKQIKFAKDNCDVTIVLIHGGLEYFPIPRPGLVEYCRFLVDCGVAAVICNHTHIPSAIEIYNKAPIVYGMGNFLFDRKGKAGAWHHGYYTKLSISKAGVHLFQIKPYEQCRGYIGIKSANNEVNDRIIENIYNASLPLQDHELHVSQWENICNKLADRYIIGLRSPVIFYGIGRLIRIFPFIRSLFLLPEKHAVRVLNLVRCETHKEVLETVLNLYINRFKK